MSTIDDLQRLHEAATPTTWLKATAEIYNAWPAIHRVLVAARALMQCPKCIGPCDDPTVHAEIEEALRALDDKEQGR